MPPSYDQLRNDAVSAYLSSGGTQANVDNYFAQNSGQDYNQLARDSAQWYAGQAGVGQADAANQNIAGYFGIEAPPAGQNYNFTPPTTPATQSYRYAPAIADPSMSVNGPVTPSGLGSSWSAPQTAQESQAQSNPFSQGNNNMPGGRGSLANAQADPGDYWRQHQGDAWAAGANQGEWAPGSGVADKDPWMAPMHQYMSGQRVYQPGYGMGANGETMRWQGDKPPGGLGNDPKGNPVLTGGQFDLSGLPEANWLQSQFGVKPPDWKNAQDVVRYRRQLQYYWPDIIQRDPSLAKYDPAGKVKNPAFLDSEESGTY